jgi:Uma2 family endonuclease
MAGTTAIPVKEFLANRDYRYAEYLDGEVVERPFTSYPHNRALARLVAAFMIALERTRLFPAPTQHIPIAARRYRVPDLCVYAGVEPTENYPTTPPLAIFEVLSPEDSYSSIRDRFNEYRAFGVERLWLVDPEARVVQRYEGGSLITVDTVEIASHNFHPPAAEIFA